MQRWSYPSIFCLFILMIAPPVSAAVAELPREFIHTEPQPLTGQIIPVPAGGDLRAALRQAQPGDVIELQPGAVYTGPFELPAKKAVKVGSSSPAQAPIKPCRPLAAASGLKMHPPWQCSNQHEDQY